MVLVTLARDSDLSVKAKKLFAVVELVSCLLEVFEPGRNSVVLLVGICQFYAHGPDTDLVCPDGDPLNEASFRDFEQITGAGHRSDQGHPPRWNSIKLLLKLVHFLSEFFALFFPLRLFWSLEDVNLY